MSVEIKVPHVGEAVSEVTIASWLKGDGDFVEKDDILCEIDSDKATFEIPADESGVLRIKKEEGETAEVGEIIAEIEPGEGNAEKPEPKEAPERKQEPRPAEAEEAKEKPREESPEEKKEPEAEKAHLKISPVAAKILEEAGISPSKVKGTGPGGKITKDDALKAVDGQAEAEEPQTEVEAPQEKKPQPEAPKEARAKASGAREERRKKMTTLRKTIARRLVTAKNETAMLTTFNDLDMSEIMKLRSRYKEIFKERYEIGLGFMSFFTRACCIALAEFPEANASIDEDEIVFHDYCDIGIAVSTDRGLVVPVIRNAESLTLAEIEKEIEILAGKARDNKLTIEEMTGGTFTITNGGVFGSLLSTPIINYPQSAILGMHRIEQRPVVINGQIEIRPMMYIALSYDHRMIDGRDSVRFLKRVKELLEDPARMLLEV